MFGINCKNFFLFLLRIHQCTMFCLIHHGTHNDIWFGYNLRTTRERKNYKRVSSCHIAYSVNKIQAKKREKDGEKKKEKDTNKQNIQSPMGIK